MITMNASTTLADLPYHDVALIGFYFVVGIYCIFTAILYYHWNEYGTDRAVTRLTLISYFATTIPLLLIMGIMVLIL